MVKNKAVNKSFFLIAVILAPLLFNGCLNVSDEFSALRNIALAKMGQNYKKEIEFSADSFGLQMAKSFIKFSNSDRATNRILRNVKSVQVGTYKLKDAKSSARGIPNYRKIISAMEKKNWHYILHKYSSSETDIIFAKVTAKGRCEDLFVVSLAHGELNLVLAHGNMDKVILEIISDNNFKMDFIGKR